jgi:hypothetical protein
MLSSEVLLSAAVPPRNWRLTPAQIGSVLRVVAEPKAGTLELGCAPEAVRSLLDAQRARLAVRLSANDSSTRLLLDSVQLYKALGGGWQVFEPTSEAPARPTAVGATAASHS